jgi:HPt (histidine-containing phosphotransfer) domain-containing protein
MSHTEKSYRLDKLIEFIGDDEAAVSSMVGIFLRSTPELMTNISEALQKNDIPSVGKYAHMLKPSLGIFGIETAFELIKKIESTAKSSTNEDQLPEMFESLQGMLNIAIADIRADYPGL